MAKKYHNEHDVALFGSYTDPFIERRGNGSIRPLISLVLNELSFDITFEDNKLYYLWLGHSSVFLHISGLNILIDPVFSKFVSPLPFAGPKRFEGQKISADIFPQIDAVLITHSHYDHLDKKTLKLLDHKVKRYIVPEGIRDVLKRFGINKDKVVELNWYKSVSINDLKITLTPSQHDSGRGPLSMDATLWGGYLLKDNNFTVYDTGDGGYADHFKKIYQRYGKTDLAIMECGQYNCKWHAIHMFPEESVEAAIDLYAELATPVHYGAYVLSDHPYNDPPIRFSKRAEERNLNYRIMNLYEWLIIEKS